MNLLRVDHTGVAVRDLDEALDRYRRVWGLTLEHRAVVPDQQVEVAFLRVGDTQIELISPTSPDTAVARFLDRRGEGLHHVAFAVGDIERELARLEKEGAELIDRHPRRGVHGLVAFVHPRASGGVLIELVQNVDQEEIQG
jgi:methylmalonyl-CoA/ethylmalonyl-CoA epimerase